MAKKKTTSTDELLKIVVEALLDKKGKHVVSLDLRNIKDTVSQYFVIAHGDSTTQVNALYDSVVKATKEAGHKAYHTEGGMGAEWMIVDFVDVTVHIFYREKRDFYALEELWNDAVSITHEEQPEKPNTIKARKVRQRKDDK